MFQSRRVELARQALPSVTAWAELVIGPEKAAQLASDAVVEAASASGATTLPQVTRAARDDVALRLARGECRVPTLSPLEASDPSRRSVAAVRAGNTHADADAESEDDANNEARADSDAALGEGVDAHHTPESSAPYLPGNDLAASVDVAPASARPDETESHETQPRHAEPERDRRSPAERLADALPKLRPHERLAAVRYYLDGESVEAIADLFGVSRDDAVKLLEQATAVLAPIVGEHDLPDFASEATEIEVVSR